MTREQIEAIEFVCDDLRGIVDEYQTYGDDKAAEAIDGVIEYIELNYIQYGPEEEIKDNY